MRRFWPGPALSALTTGQTPVLLFVLFVAAMIVGMLLHDRMLAKAV
jgi:uncharacterized membrane protein YedE/YeeE